jgi:putative transposase
MFEGEKRCGYEVWDYVIMGNHYHAMIYIPRADAMSRAEVLRRWQEAELAVNRPVQDDPNEEVLEAHRQRIHDISFIVGNFQQRFTQWHNKRNDRWGKLFGGRLDSVLLDEHGAVARVMAYITLNAVREQIVDDPTEYRWSGYAERMAKGELRDNDRNLAVYLQRELGMADGMLQGSDEAVMSRVWKRFRETLIGARVKRSDFNNETLAELLNASNKPLELGWPERLRLKTTFVTKGIALESQTFVEKVLEDFSEKLGYRRRRGAQQARAWDEVTA